MFLKNCRCPTANNKLELGAGFARQDAMSDMTGAIYRTGDMECKRFYNTDEWTSL